MMSEDKPTSAGMARAGMGGANGADTDIIRKQDTQIFVLKLQNESLAIRTHQAEKERDLLKGILVEQGTPSSAPLGANEGPQAPAAGQEAQAVEVQANAPSNVQAEVSAGGRRKPKEIPEHLKGRMPTRKEMLELKERHRWSDQDIGDAFHPKAKQGARKMWGYRQTTAAIKERAERSPKKARM